MRKNYANLEGTSLEPQAPKPPEKLPQKLRREPEIEERTWKYYERMLAEGKREKGLKYYAGNVMKESSAVKSLMSEYTPSQMEGIIKFLLSDEQTFVAPEYVGLQLLMGSWKNTIIPAALKWMEGGKLPTKSKNEMPREYKRTGKGITIS